MITISDGVLKHIIRKHGADFSRLLGITRLDELRRLLKEALTNPDETHVDARNPRAKFFLKKKDALWLLIVVVGREVKTAYLISFKTYKRLAYRRWL